MQFGGSLPAPSGVGCLTQTPPPPPKGYVVATVAPRTVGATVDYQKLFNRAKMAIFFLFCLRSAEIFGGVFFPLLLASPAGTRASMAASRSHDSTNRTGSLGGETVAAGAEYFAEHFIGSRYILSL